MPLGYAGLWAPEADHTDSHGGAGQRGMTMHTLSARRPVAPVPARPIAAGVAEYFGDGYHRGAMNPNPDPNHEGHRALEFSRRVAGLEKPIDADGTPVHSKSYRLMLSEQTAPRCESKAARRMRRRRVR